MKYKVIFAFRNDSGANVVDDLTNDGKGFSFGEARRVARELRAQGMPAEVLSIRNHVTNTDTDRLAFMKSAYDFKVDK